MFTEQLIAAEFRHAPFHHQYREFESHVESPARALAWSMRTGKSKAIVDKACHLYRRDLIDAVLIFAPNGVHANWIEREVPAHIWPGIESIRLTWRSQLRGDARAEWYRELWRAQNESALVWLAVNSESMIRNDVRQVIAFLLRHRRIFVVFDESDDFGIPGSKRTRMARALAPKCVFRAILSGTIATASPLRVFTQYELLEQGALGCRTYGEFQSRYAIFGEGRGANGRRFPRVIGFQREEELRARMAKYTSVVLRDDCHDMPALIMSERAIELSDAQKDLYEQLRRSFIAEIDGREVSIGEQAVKFGKLHQVVSGFLIDELGVVHDVPGPIPRLQALSEEVYLAPGKVIVWCNFKADINRVKKQLFVDGVECVEYHGAVTDKDRTKALVQFRENENVKVMIGHPQAGGRGIDMSAASTMIRYSHTFSARMSQQAMERATKIGGGNIRVIDFVAPGPDRVILDSNQSRISLADRLAGQGMKTLLEEMTI